MSNKFCPASAGLSHDAAAKPVGALPEMMSRCTGFLLARAGLRVKEMLNQHLQPFGIHVRHYAVLAMLMESPAAQVAMADRLCIDRTSMVALLDELETRGYVHRTTNPQDRRMHVVQITAGGKALVHDGEQCVHQAEAELLGALTPGEREELHGLLLKLLP